MLHNYDWEKNWLHKKHKFHGPIEALIINPHILFLKKKEKKLLLVTIDAHGFIGYNHHGAIQNPKKLVLDQNSTIKNIIQKELLNLRKKKIEITIKQKILIVILKNRN